MRKKPGPLETDCVLGVSDLIEHCHVFSRRAYWRQGGLADVPVHAKESMLRHLPFLSLDRTGFS